MGASESSRRGGRFVQRGVAPDRFALEAVSGVGLRVLVLLGVAAALLSRALAPALPGTAAGIERWITASRALGATVSAHFFVIGSMVLVWLAVASLAEARLPTLVRVVALPVSFTVIVVGVAAVVSTVEPRWLLGLSAASGLVALVSAPRALAAVRSRAAGLVLIVAGLSAYVEVAARALALRAGERALAGWFLGAQVLATGVFVLEVVALFVVALWVRGRRPWVTALGAAAVAAVAVATTAAGVRGLQVDAHPVEVLVARALSELTRHPRPLVSLTMLHALEVARYALVTIAVLVPGRAPTSAAALALALLCIGSTDVPACAVMLSIAALVGLLGAIARAADTADVVAPPPSAGAAAEDPSSAPDAAALSPSGAPAVEVAVITVDDTAGTPPAAIELQTRTP